MSEAEVDAAPAQDASDELGVVLSVTEALADPDASLSAPRVAAARASFENWRSRVAAPAIEVRRAQRRLAAVAPALARAATESALKDADVRIAAMRLVEACAARDRDFAWDVPLRDLSRALVEAALASARAPAQPVEQTAGEIAPSREGAPPALG